MSELLSFVTNAFLLEGALLAIEISALALLLGLLLGLGLALMRVSERWILRNSAGFYIWFIRGTPLLLQLVFLFDMLPHIGLTLNNFVTAVIGFALNEAAFSAEYIRGGIGAVNKSQITAAQTFGMGRSKTLKRIILPQAMPVILPQIGNSAANMLKGTSIASIIFVNELTFRAEQIVAENFKFFTVFGAAALMYLAMTSLIGLAQTALERRFSLDREINQRKGFSWFRLNGRGDRADQPALQNHSTALAAASGAVQGVERNPIADGPHHWLENAVKQVSAPAAAGEPYVVCRDVWKSYSGRDILKGIDLSVAKGEVVVILGPSGSGKSTLLKIVNHLETLDRGEVTVGGKYIGYKKVAGRVQPTASRLKDRADARIGMVFQQFNLFEHLTVMENVMEAPIQVYGDDPIKAAQRARDLCIGVGLGKHLEHRPRQLSGGQQQRVGIARALAISPRLMLFDEPTSALDPELVSDMLDVMKSLVGAGMTMLIVTHEINFAREVADRVVFIDEGEIVEQGPPAQVIDAPRHPRTRRFLHAVRQSPSTALASESTPPLNQDQIPACLSMPQIAK